MSGEVKGEQKTYFYAACCPLHHECSQASWSRAKAWGWSEDECKQAVAEHLFKSMLHAGIAIRDDAMATAEMTEIVEEAWTEPPPAKKQRQAAAGPSSSALAVVPLARSSVPHDKVLVPKAKIKEAIDSLKRAHTAVKQATHSIKKKKRAANISNNNHNNDNSKKKHYNNKYNNNDNSNNNHNNDNSKTQKHPGQEDVHGCCRRLRRRVRHPQ